MRGLSICTVKVYTHKISFQRSKVRPQDGNDADLADSNQLQRPARASDGLCQHELFAQFLFSRC